MRLSFSLTSILGKTESLLVFLFKWLLLLGLLLYGLSPQIVYCDMPWHIAEGRWMVHHLAFLRHDLFNYPNLNASIIDEYPAFQIPLYLIYRVTGEWGAGVVCAALLFLTYWLFFRAVERRGPMGLLPAIIIFAAVPTTLQRLILRPELLTDLGIVVFMMFLLAHYEETDWRKFWPLYLFQVFWVNAHSGFILGPLLVFGFAFERIAAAAWRRKGELRQAMRTWLPVCLLIGGACLVNPYGLGRLWLPFYHQGAGVIRAYVTEMQPLAFNPDDFLIKMVLTQLALMFVSILVFRGRISWTFFLLALYFYHQIFNIQRHMAVFGFLAPGVIISGLYFDEAKGNGFKWLRPGPVLRIPALLLLMLSAFLFTSVQVTDTSTMLGFAERWRSFRAKQTEYPMVATDWMHEHHIEGKLIHRSEVGGWLQYAGFDHGQTHADTGFGKFDQQFIHEIGLICDRPGYLPWVFKKYQPDFAVVASTAYNWPVILRREGWRCIFYSTGGSVWTWGSRRPDLPTVTHDEIAASVDAELKKNGIPSRLITYYRSLLALESMGCEDIAFQKLGGLPPSQLKDSLLWAFAECYCYEEKGAAPEHIEALHRLADTDDSRGVSHLFRARYLYEHKRYKEAIDLIEPIVHNLPNDPLLIILADSYLAQGRFDEAFFLLRHNDLFDLKDGHRWELLAECEEKAGTAAAAAIAWKNALFFSPDDASIRKKAGAFSSRHPDPEIDQTIKDIEHAL